MRYSRRHWLWTTAGAPALLRAGVKIDPSWISVITDEIARSPEGAITFARQYGLRHVELRSVPGPGRGRPRYSALSNQELKAAADQFRDAGLAVSFFNSGLLKHCLPGVEPVNPKHKRATDEDRFRDRLDLLKREIEAARILGVDKIRVFAFFRTKDNLALFPRIAGILAEFAEVAEREKVTLLIENEAACNVATCAELAAITELVPSPAIGVNWDPLNGTRYQEQPMPDGYHKLPKQRIGNVQIKGKSILPEWNELLDWRGIFDTMIAEGYRGKFGLETHIFGEGQIQASHDSMKEILRIVEST
jgi:sugar phosphate isomerase/epimerase